MAQVIIKKGSIEIKADRMDLIEVSETHDGVAFNFKGGLQIYQTDPNMASAIKQLMSNSANRFENGMIIFDLDNQKTPVRVEL